MNPSDEYCSAAASSQAFDFGNYWAAALVVLATVVQTEGLLAYGRLANTPFVARAKIV